jgi:hypothetical protein
MTVEQALKEFGDRYPAQIAADTVQADVEREIAYWHIRVQAGDPKAVKYLAMWEGRRNGS